jgi:hypothetical protein
MRYVRQGERNFNIVIKKDLLGEELNSVYKLYQQNAERIGFSAKDIEAVKCIEKNSITCLALNKDTGEVSGFLMAYLSNMRAEEEGNIKVSQLIFTGLNEDGQKSKLGFALHFNLFTRLFEEEKVTFIDFHGASRAKSRSYVGFKTMFGGEFISLPGSFEKFYI